jgi:hypothetical protein
MVKFKSKSNLAQTSTGFNQFPYLSLYVMTVRRLQHLVNPVDDIYEGKLKLAPSILITFSE